MGESLEERADGLGVGHILGKLVAGIAGVEVREDQDVGLAGDFAFGFDLLGGNAGHDGGIGLELAVKGELRCSLPSDGQGLGNFLNAGMGGAAMGRKR